VATTAYLRVRRGGDWQNIEVEYLTRKERHAILSGRDSENLVRWIDILCETLCKLESEGKRRIGRV